MAEKLTLTRPQKAAAILVAMGKPAAGRLLKFFKQDELKALIEAARALRTIPQAELERIVGEFESEFAEGAGLLDSADTMNTLLNEALPPEEVNLLMGRGDATLGQDNAKPVWPELEKLDPARLAELLAREHPQTIALILTKLSSQPAANVLVAMGKPLRGEVLKRMMTVGPVATAARQLIESRMREILRAEAGGKDVSAGQTRVANLLNELEKQQVDEVIRDLEEAGSDDVAAIRARLFSFEEVPLLSQKARVALFDGQATDQVTLALRNAPPELAEAVLSALGARSRRMIEAELAGGAEGVTPEDVSRARRSIAAAAVRLAQQGAFELPGAQAAA